MGYVAPALSPVYDSSLLEQDRMLEAAGKSLHVAHTTTDITCGEVTLVIAGAFQGPLCLLIENLRSTPGFS